MLLLGLLRRGILLSKSPQLSSSTPTHRVVLTDPHAKHWKLPGMLRENKLLSYEIADNKKLFLKSNIANFSNNLKRYLVFVPCKEMLGKYHRPTNQLYNKQQLE